MTGSYWHVVWDFRECPRSPAATHPRRRAQPSAPPGRARHAETPSTAHIDTVYVTGKLSCMMSVFASASQTAMSWHCAARHTSSRRRASGSEMSVASAESVVIDLKVAEHLCVDFRGNIFQRRAPAQETYLADFDIRRPQPHGPLNRAQHLLLQPYHANIVPSALHAFQLLCYRRVLYSQCARLLWYLFKSPACSLPKAVTWGTRAVRFTSHRSRNALAAGRHRLTSLSAGAT